MYQKLIVMGDSITRGTYTGEHDDCPKSIASPCFAELVQVGLQIPEMKNYGMNGISVSRTTYQSPDYAISLYIDQVETGDILLVAAGTNDYGTNVELGSPEDKEDVSFYGGLNVLYKKITEKFKGAKVYIVSPIKRLGDKNQKGYTLEQYKQAIAYRAAEYGFSVIDGYNVAINPSDSENRKAYILDGLHPNTAGHKLYAEYILEKINEYENGNL